jgi:DNA-binding winged helix-turn-helix (wHTH) protein
MTPKSGYRFSEKVMLKQKAMIPKSGYRFSEKIMLMAERDRPSRP